MSKIKPTPDLLLDILARIPEGFISLSALAQRLEMNGKTASLMLANGRLGRHDDLFYDTARITLDELQQKVGWCRPAMPEIGKKGELNGDSVEARRAERNSRLAELHSPVYGEVVHTLEAHPAGYLPLETLATTPAHREAVHKLLSMGLLRHSEELVYDPLRLGQKTMRVVSRQHRLVPLRDEIIAYLSNRPGGTASQAELAQRLGNDALNDVLASGGFTLYNVPVKKARNSTQVWVRLSTTSAQAAFKAALKAVKIRDEEWQPLLAVCGEKVRAGGRDGVRARTKVVARTYLVSAAAKYLDMKPATLTQAVEAGGLPAFEDPEERMRLPAAVVESMKKDTQRLEEIASFEVIRPKELALACGVGYIVIQRRLKKIALHKGQVIWGSVRGQWGLPDTLQGFRQLLEVKAQERAAEKQARLAELLEIERQRREQEQMQAELERQRRNELRLRLVEAFPTWRHDGRVDQQIVLHVGPPNSGKTHQALETLANASSGWYLAPLRLLAFEIFDRLNQAGVPCNLLTGEEYVPIPGATITAATVEMFNASESGECVIIDEAQMLADADRGWAWTRALMTAKAPEIRVIGPGRVRHLVERLAAAAAIPLKVVEHERLAPISVADRHWSLRDLPRRTILVAFSRWMVLHLKTDLERMNRRVSVVYGNLPPEVRRKQADRFANGETEICVATDAVGMGLNLPADYVCFYEVEKFDGKRSRRLTPDEIQQIGGRAGRFGLSEGGVIGATNKNNLNYIRRMYYEEAQELTHARVAPSVEDLDMIPGVLAEKLAQWASLQSIPEYLRSVIKTADMTERIELSKMLEEREVEKLGLEMALKLVNAPTRQSSRAYWFSCVRAILRNVAMPVPEDAPGVIVDSDDLEQTEYCISCADIYLWLARRPEFRYFAPDEEHVRHLRMEWSSRIDRALVLKLDTSRRCAQCKRPLPLGYRYRICDNCYNRRYTTYEYDDPYSN